MPVLNSISVDKLSRLIGTPGGPAIVDVRTPEEFATDRHLLPGAMRRSHSNLDRWAAEFQGRSAVVVCGSGSDLSHGVAARLRHGGVAAQSLEGGASAWAAAGLCMVRDELLPPRDEQGSTTWVTRSRPKVDRIACPWLIRRFIDPAAIFLFVPPAEVAGVAKRFAAAPFDVENAFWSHRGELCTFDVMVEEFGLASLEPLRHVARIVRGADTARPELAPQAAGLLAISLGLSRIYSDDLKQLEAGMLVYDALYRWCRDAVDETHDWASHTPRSKVRK